MKISFFVHHLRPIMTVCSSIFQKSYSVSEIIVRKSHNKKIHCINQNTKRYPMRDRMSTVSQYLGNRQRMDSMNDSVIVCDTFTPKQKDMRNRKNAKRRGDQCKSKLNDKNDALSNSQVRLPLRTVYESPLDHRVHNTRSVGRSMVVNLAAKRFRNDQDDDIPPAKKQKINKLNETIVIVSDDDEPKPPKPSQTCEVVLVDLDKSVSEAKPIKSPKKKRKPRRSVRIHEQMISKNAVKSKEDREDEEIAVIWDSTSGGTSERMNVEVKNFDPPSELFYLDTTGDESNFQKQCLQPTEPPPPKLPICRNQTTLKKRTKAKGKKKLKGKLREIIVDGCNVAIGYSHSKIFTKMGLKLVYDYFRERGHTVKIFLPQHQRKKGREYLEAWYRRGDVIFTPSRQIGGKNIVSYDDRFIVEYATKCNGIIVTSDQYRDLWEEKPEWRETIEKRLLVPTFVGDYVMFPQDPLGRTGPKLDEFLRH